MTTILCVDDDPYLTDLLRYGFEREGFDVTIASTGREGLSLIRAKHYDLVVLDVNMPDMNGFKVLSALRTFSTIPVIMLTARTQDDDIITGFGAGADDYVVKPFSMQVLVTHVRAVLRRAAPPTPAAAAPGAPTYEVAGALFDPETYALTAPDGTVARLTPTEGRILQLLALHRGQVLSAERIMDRLWNGANESDVNVIKTHIRNLREKMGHLPGRPQPIRTMPGAGYVLQADNTEKPT